MPLFFFPCRIHGAKGKPREGQKTPFKRLFAFRGYSHISPTAERAKRGEKSRENDNSTHNAQRNTRHGSKITAQERTKSRDRTKTPPTAQTPRKRPKKGNRGKPTKRPRRQGGSDHGHGRRNLSASPRAYAPTREKTVASVVGGF